MCAGGKPLPPPGLTLLPPQLYADGCFGKGSFSRSVPNNGADEALSIRGADVYAEEHLRVRRAWPPLWPRSRSHASSPPTTSSAGKN